MNRTIFTIAIRAVPTLISVIMLIIFILPFSHGIINIGNLFGAAFSAFCAALFVFYEKFFALAKRLQQSGAGRVCLIAAAVLTAAFIIYASIVSVLMVKAASDRPKNGNTVLIVLGCKVRDGEPSGMLRRRLDAAYDFLSENNEAVAVLSGGQGSDEIISEAQCMKNYLVKKGISPERLYMEDKSSSTEENLKFSAELIERECLDGEVTIVTDGYHQLRAELLAGKFDIEPYNISAPTESWLLPTYWVREWFGLAYYGIFKG